MEVYKKDDIVLEGEQTKDGIIVQHDQLKKLIDNLTERNVLIKYSFICVTENYAAVTCDISDKTTGRTITEIGECKGEIQCEAAFRLAFDKAAIRFLDIQAISDLQYRNSNEKKPVSEEKKPENEQNSDKVTMSESEQNSDKVTMSESGQNSEKVTKPESKQNSDKVTKPESKQNSDKATASGKVTVKDYKPVFGDFTEGKEDFGLSVSQFFKKAEENKITSKKLEDYISLDPTKEAEKETRYGLRAIQIYLTKGYILNGGVFSRKNFTAQNAFEVSKTDETLKAAVQMYLSADIDRMKTEKDRLCLLALQAQAEAEQGGTHGQKG